MTQDPSLLPEPPGDLGADGSSAGISDRRTVRTRTSLSNALVKLLHVQQWKKITVRDITEEANVGRSTFYAHFPTKFDLLLAQLPSFRVSIGTGGSHLDFVPLFDHVRKNAGPMRSIIAQPVRNQVNSILEDRLTEDWLQVLAGHDEKPDPLTARFLAGATLASMSHYLGDPTMATPQQMSDRLAVLVCKVISTDK